MKQKFNTIITKVHKTSNPQPTLPVSNNNPMNSTSKFSPTKPSPFLKQAFFPIKSDNSLEATENEIIRETLIKKQQQEASSNNEFKETNEIDNIITIVPTISKQFIAEDSKIIKENAVKTAEFQANSKEIVILPKSPRVNNVQTLDFIVSPRIQQISNEEIAKTMVFQENNEKNMKKSLGLSVKTKGISRRSSRNLSPENNISNNLMINSSLLERNHSISQKRNSFNLGNLFVSKTPTNRRFSFGKTIESSLIFNRKSDMYIDFIAFS